jgi:preprotein translocase subunit SecE
MQADKAKQIARSIIDSYPQDELSNLINWSNAVLAIRKTEWPAHKKLMQIGRVTKEMGITAPFVKHLGNELKRVGWDDRTKTMRGVIGGAGVGLLASIAGPMAGVAAFGGAVAVPVILLGAGAGAVLTAIVDDFGRHK